MVVDDEENEDNKPLHCHKHDPHVPYLAAKVVYFSEQFRKSDHHIKKFMLTKDTTATNPNHTER